MTRAIVVVAALAVAPPLAEAHHHCAEQSSIVGYQVCSRFGARWTGLASMWWEFGVASLHFDPRPLDAIGTNRVTFADARPITAAGGRFRWLAGIGRTWFFGSELDLASVTHGPRVIAETTLRDTAMTIDTGTGGFVGQSKFLVGVHRTFGLVTAAGAVGVGGRIAFLEPEHYSALARAAGQAWFLVDAHAKLDAWIAPNVTVGVDASVDLVHRDDYAVGLVLGLHLVPFDRTR